MTPIDTRIATWCTRCGEQATLPTAATFAAYVRQHDATCPPTESEDA